MMDWLLGLIILLILLFIDHRLNKILKELRRLNATVEATRAPPKVIDVTQR